MPTKPETYSKKDLTELFEALGTRAQNEAEREGGYPTDYDAVKGYFLVWASVDTDEPALHTMPMKKAMRLFQTAKKRLERGEYEDMDEALYDVGL